MDDLTDSPDEWKMFTRPIAGMIEDSEIVLTPEEQGKKDNGKSGGASGGAVVKGGTKSTYTPCTPGKYVRGCKSEVVKKVQVCLKQAPKHQTGNFGPITQANLQKLGKGFENGFTDTKSELSNSTLVQVLNKGEVLLLKKHTNSKRITAIIGNS